MKLLFALCAALLLLDGSAQARLTKAALDAVYVAPPPSATLPLDLDFLDENGHAVSLRSALAQRPTVLVFADYTCRTLCGPILDFTAGALQKSGLRPGDDFRLIAIGLDPKDGLAGARAMRAAHLDHNGPTARAAMFLTGNKQTVASATTALGYHFTYDPQADQFAHPAAVFILNRDGKLTRMLSGLGLNGTDMRLALVEAGQGRIGTIADQFRLLCYCFDPALGIYTTRINVLLDIACVLTVLLMAGGILVMQRMARAVR